MQRQTITIVGGGFSGSMVALQLARLPGGPYACDVHLVEPRPAPGPGLAYSAARPEYLLNVRTQNLSAFPDEPAHFASWLREKQLPACEFCSRQTYGDYLRELTAGLLAAPAANGVRFFWHHQSAVGATVNADGLTATVRLANGREISSHRVVLALGNFPPPPPAGPATEYLAHPTYHPDPWAPGALQSIEAQDSILLIGSGLTAVDVLLGLRATGHQGPIKVVSRHGRWPMEHSRVHSHYPDFYADKLAGLTNIGAVVRVLREEVRLAAEQGVNWRAVLDSLRPHLGQIWAAWPEAEQARFLRHLASLWTTLRHRSPPQNARIIRDMLTTGQIRMSAGRVRQILPRSRYLAVQISRGPRTEWLTARHIITCTGPLLDYSRIADPLVRELRETGQLVSDSLRLGMVTDAHGALINARGEASTIFSTLGPSRRPAYFESTAVPELRQQAADLARYLGQGLF
ncbi:FAD/NAD(P)-binding protein [Hymenobacter sp. BT175]|uniref:FAD/NAD(P)-binding protein n=1 Tax=Hymenobacter translucens TaxID=2886507 RepID=UPI001D0ECCAC|nr:FAD/NAD(P)-binding protein [Hymenobacter translucens]MCC2547192.1 FAD/NAD(P)-binding protein [Hymenobacter translucens]